MDLKKQPLLIFERTACMCVLAACLSTQLACSSKVSADEVILQEQKPSEGKLLDERTVVDPADNQKSSTSVLQARIEHLHKKVLTAEDFRSLNYGILGVISVKTIFSARQTVVQVIPNCPAALAGIRPGDVEIQIGDHVLERGDNQRSNWNVADGEAGTPVDVLIKRGRKLMTFHLIRMNIEDIESNRVRRMYEQMLTRLGPPVPN